MPFKSILSGFTSGAVAIWIALARIRAWLYRIGLLKAKRLDTPVISIGNLTFGGTGKTPFAVWLAARLQSRGLRPSILTRGYKRTSTVSVKVHPPGVSPSAAIGDGDEVQIYLRHLSVAVGISASRYDAGRAVETKTPVDVHLLDDGFQHLGLRRIVNIILIDSANPWGARPGWPYLLREGFSSLKRADAVVLTRCELSENKIEKLIAGIRSYRPGIPIFLARTLLAGFVEEGKADSLASSTLSSRNAIAFCGLGNPRNFFRMIETSGIKPARKLVFKDHHKYTANDIEALANIARASVADCFLTTEKDLLNLPSTAPFAVPLYWARIDLSVENEEELLDWIVVKAGLSSTTHRPSENVKPLGGARANA